MPEHPAFARRGRGRAAAGKRAARRGRGRAKTAGLAVAVTDGRGRPLGLRALAAWLRRVAPPRARGAVTIALVSDERIRALNRTYRHKDYATDVLSFASSASSASSAPNPQSPIPNPRSLGDIVIARGVARRQAREAGHDEATELKLLALHGLLHLLGYDHERDDGRERRRLRARVSRAAAACGRRPRSRADARRAAADLRADRPRARPDDARDRQPLRHDAAQRAGADARRSGRGGERGREGLYRHRRAGRADRR